MYPNSPFTMPVANPYFNPMQASSFQTPTPQVVTPQQPWGASAAQGGIGGAGTGASIASLLSLSNPWTAAAIIGLGGLGYLSGAKR